LVQVSGHQGEDFGHQTVGGTTYRPVTKQLATPGDSPGWVPTPPPGGWESPPTNADPSGAFQVPNNFWGFVMLMMGLK